MKRNQVPKLPRSTSVLQYSLQYFRRLQLIATNIFEKEENKHCSTKGSRREKYSYGWKSKHNPLKNITILYNKKGWIPKKVISEICKTLYLNIATQPLLTSVAAKKELQTTTGGEDWSAINQQKDRR